jgi:MoaA/NifB/PqqE/SkfB family radical SAM enzyme
MIPYIDVARHVALNKINRISNPVYCTYYITWRCNLRCAMCGIWRKENRPEMTCEEIKTVFSKMKFLKAVRITGGEPFLREDLSRAVDIIRQNTKVGMIHVTTNGTFPERTALFLKKLAGPYLHLKISIDGDEATHEKIRKVKGSFSKAIETLKEASRSRAEKKFHLGVNFTVGKDNTRMDQLDFLIDLCGRFGAALYVDFAYDPPPLYAEDSPSRADKAYEEFSDIKQRLGEFITYMRKNNINDNFIEDINQKYYVWGFENRVFRAKNFPNPKCVALKSHIKILPEGGVGVCVYKPRTVGNLVTDSFKDVWYGEEAVSARKEVDNCPGCWAGCEIGPSGIFTGDAARTLFIKT